MVPLVPVRVKLWEPVDALRFTVMVMVLVPPLIGLGLNETEMRCATPEAERVMELLRVPVTVAVMVDLPDELLLMVNVEGFALRLKLPCVELVTVRVTIVVSTMLPDVAVTVMG